jgi:hypothetical protein
VGGGQNTYSSKIAEFGENTKMHSNCRLNNESSSRQRYNIDYPDGIPGKDL